MHLSTNGKPNIKNHRQENFLKKTRRSPPHTLIVGGTNGIGRELARVLSSKGHNVSIIGRNHSPKFPSQSNIHTWLIDVCQPELLESTLQEIVKKRGTLHHAVFLQRYRDGVDWDGEIETSLTATRNIFEFLKTHFSNKRNENRSIVLVGSINDRLIAPHISIGYHVAKAALWQMVRYYAVEMGKLRTRVNGISPGTVLKQESKSFFLQRKGLMKLMQEITPLGRMGTATEVANVVSFLLSPDASFVNGQNIVVDGGLSLQWQESLARNIKKI